MLILPIRSLSYFEGEADPLFYLQLCTLMLLYFMPCFFGKVCLLILLHLILIILLSFQPSFFNKRCLFFGL